MRFNPRDVAQVTGPGSFRATGDADGVWLELPSGPVWMQPDFAQAMARDLDHAAKECMATRTRDLPAPRREGDALPPHDKRPGPALGCTCGFPHRAISLGCEVHGDWNATHPDAQMPVRP